MTKEELSKYYYLSLEIKQIEAKISEINDTYMSASKINGMPKSHKISNPQEERILLVEKYQEKLERKKAKAIQEMLKIETYLLDIEDIETRMIFNYRYIEQKSWEQIAMLMHMGIATVFRKHKQQVKVNHEN